MEISLLGPLEVLRDGVVMTPSAPKLRTVLSLLVVQTNSVVRTDQIIEELWEDDPPASVTTTLQTYIYQLRKLLHLAAPNGTGSIRHASDLTALRTSPYGYALAMDPDLIDAMRFERLSDQGRKELEAGELQAAAETLSRALRLWRGPALVDVSHGPILRADTLRLEEMHKGALERRIEADLQLGRHHELLGELTRLAAQQPTHEGFQAKLMLALHRAGRRSEALKIYQRTRTTLATELGLDPSTDLEQLHRAVLAADESLDPPQPAVTVRASRTPRQLAQPAVTVRASRTPRQLPPEGPPLVGRQSQITAALAALSSRQHHAPPVVVITGPPGSGKSALCAQVGHRATGPFPDGQLYAKLLDADGRPVGASDVLAEFLRAVDVPDERIPATLSERCRMFRTWTADRRVLVALDDVVAAEQLLPLLPSNPDCGVVVAARKRFSAPDVTATVTMRPLSAEESVRLLTNMVGERRAAKDEAVLRELARLCDGLPAALHAAAARLQVRPHWPLSKLVKWLRTEVARPTTPRQDTLSLYASVERSYRVAPPATQSAFRMLTAIEAPMLSPRLAAHVLDVPEAEAESLLDELAELQLIETETGREPGLLRYRFLPGVRAVGRQLPDDGSDVLASVIPTPSPATAGEAAFCVLSVEHEPVSS